MKIAIDMDGVLCDFVSAAIKSANEKFNLKISYDLQQLEEIKLDTLIWSSLSDTDKKTYKNRSSIYQVICDTGFFWDLKPYHLAIEGIRNLYLSNHEIIILTKVLNWYDCSNEKKLWLKTYLKDIKYRLIMVGDHEAKGLVNVDFMIDDNPKVLDSIELGVPICIKQPWNIKERSRYQILASNMYEASNIILNMEQEAKKIYTDIEEF